MLCIDKGKQRHNDPLCVGISHSNEEMVMHYLANVTPNFQAKSDVFGGVTENWCVTAGMAGYQRTKFIIIKHNYKL